MEFTADDLHDLGEIGRGGFGTVNKMVHRKSNTIMAVKVRSVEQYYVIYLYCHYVFILLTLKANPYCDCIINKN